MVSINPRFNVDPGTEFTFRVGGYVRRREEDWGTGMVIARSRAEVVNEDNRVVEQIVYTIHWLDQKDANGDRTVHGSAAQSDLESSARGVQTFTSPEEADAWMEQQMADGNWTDIVQDRVDTRSDLDVGLQKILEEGSRE